MEEINLEFMSFSEAMQNFLEGKKVSRAMWDGSSIKLSETGRIIIFYADEQGEKHYEDLHIDMEDISAVDWYVVE